MAGVEMTADVIEKPLMAATGRRIRWSPGNVSNLRCLTRKGYKYAQSVLKIPLPSASTLSRWTRAFRVTPGVMDAAASVLEAVTTDMSDMDRLCVISFDEMSLDSRYCYDSTADQVLRGSKLQLLMVRGLCSPWKQTLYYQLDSAMTPGELVHVIVRLESIGLSVVAATSDMHSSNEKLWEQMGVTPTKTWIKSLHDDAAELTAAVEEDEVEEEFRAVTLQPKVPPVISITEEAEDGGAATNTVQARARAAEDACDKSYKYAQADVLKIPLPSASTLSCWTRAVRLETDTAFVSTGQRLERDNLGNETLEVLQIQIQFQRPVELTAAVEEAYRAVTLQPTVPPVIGEHAGDGGAATDTGKAVPKLLRTSG
ncbi:Transposable element P transposase [Amphibalanus amphitrite]|uniref:Transposable element P transposase n=1 Tax=Amphibalanus amphitrite TaxID=1232801 RepID=A0A6A4VGX2_AMPAM|nr:Transposable element P transposase [Amphibalanus amphitrite]